MGRIYDLPFCFFTLIYLRQKDGRGFQTELFRNFFGLNYSLFKKDYNTIKADISYYVSGKITGDTFWEKKLKIGEYYAEYTQTPIKAPIKPFFTGTMNYSTKEEDVFVLAVKERICNMDVVSSKFWGVLCERQFLKETIKLISHSNVPKDSALYIETAKIDQLLKDHTDLELDNASCKDVISEFWYQAILYCLRHNDTICLTTTLKEQYQKEIKQISEEVTKALEEESTELSGKCHEIAEKWEKHLTEILTEELNHRSYTDVSQARKLHYEFAQKTYDNLLDLITDDSVWTSVGAVLPIIGPRFRDKTIAALSTSLQYIQSTKSRIPFFYVNAREKASRIWIRDELKKVFDSPHDVEATLYFKWLNCIIGSQRKVFFIIDNIPNLKAVFNGLKKSTQQILRRMPTAKFILMYEPNSYLSANDSSAIVLSDNKQVPLSGKDIISPIEKFAMFLFLPFLKLHMPDQLMRLGELSTAQRNCLTLQFFETEFINAIYEKPSAPFGNLESQLTVPQLSSLFDKLYLPQDENLEYVEAAIKYWLNEPFQRLPSLAGYIQRNRFRTTTLFDILINMYGID